MPLRVLVRSLPMQAQADIHWVREPPRMARRGIPQVVQVALFMIAFAMEINIRFLEDRDR